MLKLYQVYDGESHWIVAESPAQALDIGKKEYSIDADGNGTTVDDVLVVPMDREFSVYLDDYYTEDKGDYPVPPEQDEKGRWVCKATVEKWVNHAKSGDLIASSIW